MSIFFSISMPVHNAEKYLDEAIRSVVEQDYDNFELILVDDSSTDESLDICEKWRSKNPGLIRVYKSRYKGSLCARRECIHNSNGEYLYIMDSDDYLIDKTALKMWDEIIREKNCDLIIFNEVRESNYVFNNSLFEDGTVIEDDNLIFLYDAIVTGRGLNPIWDKVFSKDIVDMDEGVYIEHSYLSHATDFYQSIAIVSNAKRVCYLNKILYYYRQTPGSITHTYNPNMLRSAEAIIARRNSIAETWELKPDNLDKKLKAFALIEYCTVLNKVRNASLSVQEKIEVLDEISKSEMFRNSYDAKNLLGFGKRTIVKLIRMRLYRLLLLILKFA